MAIDWIPSFDSVLIRKTGRALNAKTLQRTHDDVDFNDDDDGDDDDEEKSINWNAATIARLLARSIAYSLRNNCACNLLGFVCAGCAYALHMAKSFFEIIIDRCNAKMKTKPFMNTFSCWSLLSSSYLPFDIVLMQQLRRYTFISMVSNRKSKMFY